ncbi:hypothetical protein PIB30_059670 [Stylosanthes scabra]|uniref:Uncharacterized protein n=1 Tax=Stylosanthes scabra TaxID=79078 RepID=A0ABU6WK63_9FABA|nr:hypothetical protein [Stylosanthes scabra]
MADSFSDFKVSPDSVVIHHGTGSGKDEIRMANGNGYPWDGGEAVDQKLDPGGASTEAGTTGETAAQLVQDPRSGAHRIPSIEKQHHGKCLLWRHGFDMKAATDRIEPSELRSGYVV